MTFVLEDVVPWGRNLEEYCAMFGLSSVDLDRSIISFGDGPSSFNFELHSMGGKCISIDPIYQFPKEDLLNRFNEVREIVMKQVRENSNYFVWNNIKNADMLEVIRVQSMMCFLDDFEKGIKSKRYIPRSLPNKLPFSDNTFDLGLSSHFLLLYSHLGIQFHISSIKEMLRICKEIRIFPLLNLDAQKSEVLEAVISFFEREYTITIESVEYEFQKNGNQMLRIVS